MRFLASRILRAASSGKSLDYSHTLHLPKSTFPARPSPAKLDEYRQRCADDLYAWQRVNRPHEDGDSKDSDFILHDGPPYANGDVHVGHALNKILKDLILRTELSRGKRVHYRPGWDCHGLPIELKALQQGKNKKSKAIDSPDAGANAHVKGIAGRDAEVRASARELATRTIEDQKREFRQWAVMGEWDKPYSTMQADFEIRQLEVFRQMVKNDLIFRDFRPVYWSPSSRTALAESELEYDDQHKCTAAFIKMPLIDAKGVLAEAGLPIYAVIWTTTPWTLPANKAIAVNPEVLYSLCRLVKNGEVSQELYIIGNGRNEHVQSYLSEGQKLEDVGITVTGAELIRSTSGCNNPFSGSTSPIVTASFVSDSSGTGLVHMAPGHGMEDYQVCQDLGIGPAFAPVDDAGRYTTEVAPSLIDQAQLPGLAVEKEGAAAVISILQQPHKHFRDMKEDNLVLAAHQFSHKNPIDWRTKKPVIVRSTAQWFADVSRINEPALKSLEDVRFIPHTGRNRLSAFIQGRSQWCISRQRAWGVPIPVLYHKTTDRENKSDEVIQHITKTIGERGTDAWFTDAMDDPAWIPSSLDSSEWIRKRDTMDVWFDSGTSWTSMSERDGGRFADVYSEGSDQHRGWFQSSLLTKIATGSTQAPYKTVITHGFTLDGDGRKMSKSIGNVISPSEIVSGALTNAAKGKKKQDPLGPDLLRLFVASCDYTKDFAVSAHALQILQQALGKYRVTMRFMLGVLQNSAPTVLKTDELKIYDKIVLDRLQRRSALIYQAYKDYKFFDGVREINAFISTDLSAFYFEIIKDTMYAGLQDDRARTQAVLVVILKELLHWLTPLTPHLVEEVWEHLSFSVKQDIQYPLQAVWSAPLSLLTEQQSQQANAALAFFEPVSKAVKAAQEKARANGKLGSGLACVVELQLTSGLLEKSGIKASELRDALVVSELRINGTPEVSSAETTESAWSYEEAIPDIGVARVLPPAAEKCPRCWQYTSHSFDALCTRCDIAVAEL